MCIYRLGINISKFLVTCTYLWSLCLVPLLNMCSSFEVMLFQVFETLEIKKFSNLKICNRVGATYNMRAQMIYELFIDTYGHFVSLLWYGKKNAFASCFFFYIKKAKCDIYMTFSIYSNITYKEFSSSNAMDVTSKHSNFLKINVSSQNIKQNFKPKQNNYKFNKNILTTT